MKSKEKVFTKYQVFIIAVLAVLQFTIVLDFMVLSPLGAILLKELDISTSQFGLVVSAYAFSAGASGLLAAGFADKYDRKKLLMFFYTGFILGTALCAMAPNYSLLLIARIITGIFGGVISSVSFAIISDLFKLEVRGKVMGFVQSAFAGSQVFGIPVGLLLADKFGWHAPFWLIVGFGLALGIIIMAYMKPVDAHLQIKSDRNALQHLFKTLRNRDYIKAFTGTTLLATGGFMLMPFAAAFCVYNVGITNQQLTLLYFITGVFSMIFGPIIGSMSDKAGKYQTFVVGSLISMVMVVIYTNLGITPLWILISVNVVLFVGIASRMISASALITAMPSLQDRGAFMSVNSAVQQISGGIAAAIAGLIAMKHSSGRIEHYDTLGYLVVLTMIIAMGLFYVINRHIQKNAQSADASPVVSEVLSSDPL
ncbi:MFS transporter [Paradesertivirga mongoliensis]|uniref:MFS transporter n=2 Tax=Paradesertivirga mongoliensis TaxID=2100740 RepID=A0ABW4ZPV1_9SPHI